MNPAGRRWQKFRPRITSGFTALDLSGRRDRPGERKDQARLEGITGVGQLQFHYQRDAAVRYALRHWNDPNPRFANMDTMGGGGDCTNFTSQCLLAGGWPLDYRGPGHYTEWWYRRIGDEPFDAHGDDWWSCTWSLPESQYHYLAFNYGEAVDLKRSPHEVRRLRPGDLLYYDWQGAGRFGHSAIVTGHDRFGRPLVTYRTLAPRAPVRDGVWHLRFRADARRIFAVLLPDVAEYRPTVPNWSELAPCEEERAR